MYVSVTFSSSEMSEWRNFVWPGVGQFNPSNGIDTEHAKMDSEALEEISCPKTIWLKMSLWQINAMAINLEFRDICQADSVEFCSYFKMVNGEYQGCYRWADNDNLIADNQR